MEIIIDLNALKKTNLQTDEYIIMELIRLEKNKELYSFLMDHMKLKEDELKMFFEYYEEQEWIKIVKNIDINNLTNCLVLREKYITLALPKTEEVDFDIIWNLFPVSAPTGSGNRPLRAMSLESQNYKDAKKRYLNKIKTSIKNEDVFYRLQQEIETRTNENSMKYMSNIISWINQCGWEKYEPLKKENNGAKSKSPGQEIY